MFWTTAWMVLQMLGTTGNPLARLFSEQEVKEKDQPQVVRLSPMLWERLSRIAEKETSRAQKERPKALVISRNDVIRKVLLDFADAYEAEEVAEKSHKKGH